MINVNKALKNRPIPKTEGQRLAKRVWDYREMYLLLLPSIIYVIIFHYIPMYGVIIGFQDMKIGDVYGTSTWVGLYHIKRFLKSIYLWPMLRNTLAISSLSIFLGLPITLLFAVMLHNCSNKFIKKSVQTITYVPHLLSLVVIISILRLFVASDSGLINIVRYKLGLPNIDFFSKPEYFLPMHYISGVWQSLGSSAIIFLGALSGVDEEMMEAARIDGANKARIIWSIQLPSILPTIVTVTVMNFGGILNTGVDKMSKVDVVRIVHIAAQRCAGFGNVTGKRDVQPLSEGSRTAAEQRMLREERKTAAPYTDA